MTCLINKIHCREEKLLPNKKILYKRAYRELYEVIKRLSKVELEKLPNDFIMNVHERMDTDYVFIYDESVGLLEQNFMIETKALIVEMYKRFFSNENESEYWREYDQKCLSLIEEEKRRKYSPNHIFEVNTVTKISEKTNIEVAEVSVVKVEEGFFRKMLNFIKGIFIK